MLAVRRGALPGSVRRLPLARAFHHEAVMKAETVAAWAGTTSRDCPAYFVDATVGGGGHSAALLEALPLARLLCLDRDADAVARATAVLAPFGDRARVVHCSYTRLAAAVEAAGQAGHWPRGAPLSGILADCGVSSHQLDTRGRGFSFRPSLDGPLDMRFDASSGDATAADLVNGLPEAQLVRLLREYGEEPAAAAVARAIVRSRALAAEGGGGPILSTSRLAEVVAAASAAASTFAPPRGDSGGAADGEAPRPRARHAATRTFQALRIAVNGELEGLSQLLREAPRLLSPHGGRLAVLTFHSLEDRLAKRLLAGLTGAEGRRDSLLFRRAGGGPPGGGGTSGGAQLPSAATGVT